MQAMVTQALAANRFFTMAAMPRMMRPILFSRCLAGMGYGPHIDNALMGEAPQTRIDLAFTLFLSDPESYERSEEHTSELKSLMSNSYAVFCLQKKKQTKK